MIETKFFDLGKFKKIDDAVVELDKLTNYEGWGIVCSVGKRNHILLLRRVMEDPIQVQPIQQQVQAQPTDQKMFPNAIHQ